MYAHYMKHLMDHKGSEFPTSLGLSTGTRGSLLYLKPLINGKPSLSKYRGCLGCGKMFQKLSLIEKHNDTCTKKQEHKDFCKKLLENTGVQVVSTTDGDALSKEIDKLKREVETLKRMSASDKKMVDKAEDTEATLHNILDHLADKHPSVYQEVIDYGRQLNPEVIDGYCKN